MKKITKKQQIEELQTVVAAQWRQINKLKLYLGRLVDIDWTDEQADHDAVIAILDSKEPKLKQLDQSVFDGLDAKWRFAAVSSKGYCCVFQDRPVLSDLFPGHWQVRGLFKFEGVGDNYNPSNWQNSLIERDKVELTGSDLCRAMLERGDKFVMCSVSMADDETALSAETVTLNRIVISLDKEWLYTDTGTRWHYAVPINNQGEPLTAAEAGL